MQDGWKAVWSIPYVSVAFFPSLKHNFIAYRSSKVSSSPDCIFELHQLWQSGFSKVYSNSCCSCSFEAEIIKISQSSHKMYSNNILNFQESMSILNAHTKSLETYWMHHVYIGKIVGKIGLSNFGNVTSWGARKSLNSKSEEACSGDSVAHSFTILMLSANQKRYGWFYTNLHLYKQIICVGKQFISLTELRLTVESVIYIFIYIRIIL